MAHGSDPVTMLRSERSAARDFYGGPCGLNPRPLACHLHKRGSPEFRVGRSVPLTWAYRSAPVAAGKWWTVESCDGHRADLDSVQRIAADPHRMPQEVRNRPFWT